MRVDELIKMPEVRKFTREQKRVGRVLEKLMEDGEVVFGRDARYGPPGQAISQLKDKCLVLSKFEAFARKKGQEEIAEVLAEIRNDLGMLSVRKVS